MLRCWHYLSASLVIFLQCKFKFLKKKSRNEEQVPRVSSSLNHRSWVCYSCTGILSVQRTLRLSANGERVCDGLNEKCPPWAQVFEHLISCCGIVWGGPGAFRTYRSSSRSISLGQALKVHSLIPLPVCSLCFVFVLKDVISQLLALASMLATCCHASLSWWTLISLESEVKINSVFYKLPLVTVFYFINRKVTNTCLTPKDLNQLNPQKNVSSCCSPLAQMLNSLSGLWGPWVVAIYTCPTVTRRLWQIWELCFSLGKLLQQQQELINS